jgi:hypothetical protein
LPILADRCFPSAVSIRFKQPERTGMNHYGYTSDRQCLA